MKVKQFRFFNSTDPHDQTPNWSRCYEWKYALEVIREDPSLQRIHNTCCGPDLIHQIFQQRLLETGREAFSSDLVTTPINESFRGYHVYNILEEHPDKFNCVLCISTLEELKSDDEIRKAFANLVKQTSPGGRLIITCDYPQVKLELLEELVGARCKKEGALLSGATSAFSDSRFVHLNVILIDLEMDAQ
jgi:hypothetical protein